MRKTSILAPAFALAFGVATVSAEQKPVDQLNELLRGELSAVETYRQALTSVEGQPEAETLRTFMNEHRSNASKISMRVSELGGVPSTDSGVWGTWAKTVTGTAKLLGDRTALKALKEGEEHGLKEHQEVVENINVPDSVRREVKAEFIPETQDRIEKLDTLIDSVG